MALSGQITVTTAGTAVQGTDQDGQIFEVRALAGNTGATYVGEDSGDVSSTTGYELSPGESVEIHLRNLSGVYFDAATSLNKVCWLRKA